MPTIKEKHQGQIDHLNAIIEAETDDIDESDGYRFLLWSSDKYLQSASDYLSAEDLEVCVTDGKDDLGLDMYYVDEDDEVVYLFQSKYRGTANTVKRSEIESTLGLANKLMSGTALRSVNNERLVDFAVRFRRIVDSGYEVRVVYLTTERPTQQINAVVDSWNLNPLALGQHNDVEHSAEIVDTDALLTRSHRIEQPPDVDLQFAHYYFDPGNQGVLRSIGGMVSADELVRVWETNGFAMFRDNPRGPLAAAKVNKNIAKTLNAEIERERFHLLNNGLTAVCESFTDPNDGLVRVRDLQIVNGCQTTWTIQDHKRRGGELDNVFVTVKLVETQKADSLIADISSSSNTQNAMQDWDFLFNRDDQIRIQREFDQLNPPWFYELKRGERTYISRSKAPKITIKDAAQAMWAFLGHPGSALDRARDIPRSHKSAGGTYHDVFFTNVTASQLLLPYKIHLEVKRLWKRDNPDRSSSLTGDGRFHLVWLIGYILMRELGISDYAKIAPKTIRHLSDHMDEWIEQTYGSAARSIEVVVQRYTGDNPPEKVSLRQLFRNDKYTGAFSDELEFLLRNYPVTDLSSVINASTP